MEDIKGATLNIYARKSLHDCQLQNNIKANCIHVKWSQGERTQITETVLECFETQ